MAEWCLSGSDSDEAGGRETSDKDTVDLGSLKLPYSTVLDLMKQVEKNRTLELNCLSEFHQKRQAKKKKHKRRSKIHSPAGSTFKSVEEVSETASEVRSTTSTTATDYRESIRTNMIRFDPLYDPELDDQPITVESKQSKGKKAPPKSHHEKKLASLDKILEANTRRKQKMLNETPTTSLQQPSSSLAIGGTPTCQAIASPLYEPMDTNELRTDCGNTSANSLNGPKDIPTVHSHSNGFIEGLSSDSSHCLKNGSKLAELRDVPSFRFDDDDDDSSDMETPASEVDMKFSLLSQINRVENLLDSEGLT